MWTSAPNSRNSFKIAIWPRSAATWTTVFFRCGDQVKLHVTITESAIRTSAPRSRSRRAESTWPLNTAFRSADSPYWNVKTGDSSKHLINRINLCTTLQQDVNDLNVIVLSRFMQGSASYLDVIFLLSHKTSSTSWTRVPFALRSIRSLSKSPFLAAACIC